MEIPTIEGISPSYLWIFLYVAVAVGAIIILIDKVMDVFRRRQERKDAKRPELADAIAAKVMDQLKPQFEDIDRKLANDNTRLGLHDRQIADLAARQDKAQDFYRVACEGLVALLGHVLHNGNTDEIAKAERDMKEFLIKK
mgnify:CR=1 FL=1